MQPSETGVCEHLRPVVDYVHAQGGKINFAGQAWSSNCHIWVYFGGVVLDPEALKKRFDLPDYVTTHIHRGTHDGAEQGLVCQQHKDGVMGAHPEMASGAKTIG